MLFKFNYIIFLFFNIYNVFCLFVSFIGFSNMCCYDVLCTKNKQCDPKNEKGKKKTMKNNLSLNSILCEFVFFHILIFLIDVNYL